MSKVLGPSPFLNEFGVKNERVKILYWLDRHGGMMTLADVINASTEPEMVVVHKVAGFVSDGLVRCEADLSLERLGEVAETFRNEPSPVELTDQGRALLKYA